MFLLSFTVIVASWEPMIAIRARHSHFIMFFIALHSLYFCMIITGMLLVTGWAESDECEAWIFKCSCDKRWGWLNYFGLVCNIITIAALCGIENWEVISVLCSSHYVSDFVYVSIKCSDSASQVTLMYLDYKHIYCLVTALLVTVECCFGYKCRCH